jgi:CheY-like chemotaxis protein
MRAVTAGVGMGSEPEAQVTAQPRRVLVVEDELMIRMLLEDMLGELGYTVSAAAARLDEAMQAAQEGEFDIAILDVNLNGESISPVADVLAARGIPFVLATGYGEGGMPDGYRDRPALKKPFQLHNLKHTLEAALAAGSRAAKDQQ